MDKIFAESRRAVLNPEKWAARHNAWISEAVLRIVDRRVSARQKPGRDQARIRQLRREIRTALKYNMQRWAETEGEDVEGLLTGDLPLP